MELRMILYGYRKEQFSYYVVPEEAAIICRIFSEYIKGNALSLIAKRLTEDKVVYYKDKTKWSKNAVCRVLENRHYLGDEEYPKIIDLDTFEKAESIRLSKGGARDKDSKEIEYLKEHMVCDRCKSRFTRRSKYPVRERWLCTNACPSTKEYLDDITLISKVQYILDLVCRHPGQLMYESQIEPYTPTKEVIAKEKQIKSLISQQNSMFHPIRKLINESVTEKYNAMKLDPSKEKTKVLCEYISNYKNNNHKGLDVRFMKVVVSKIIVEADGNLRIRFVNGKEISNRLVIEDECSGK